jgi:phosphohistidine phosphatase SixA
VQILIVRHGSAEVNAASDAERNLTDQGIDQARLAGECLKQQSLIFDQVWVSPYQRTQQTATQLLLAAELESTARLSVDLITPDNNPYVVAEYIQQANIDRLMIVSHQPLVSALIGVLVSSDVYAGPPMSTASMALLEMDVSAPGCASLQWLRHAPHYERSE